MNESRIITTPSGYDTAVGPWVWAFQETRRRTLDVLRSVAADAIEWTTLGVRNSIGSLLYHVAAIELSYLYEDILEIGWADELASLLPYDVREVNGRLFAVRGETLETHMARLDATRNLFLKHLAGMSADDLSRPKETAEGVVSAEWILHHLMQHEAEHRGQITAILDQAGAR